VKTRTVHGHSVQRVGQSFIGMRSRRSKIRRGGRLRDATALPIITSFASGAVRRPRLHQR
jgi:hypothetical protein